MKNYVIINHSDGTAPPTDPEVWSKFFGAIKESVVDGGKPFTPAKAVLKGGEATKGSSDTVVAYYIVKADSLDDATAIVQDSPLANKPGCEVRVYETV